LPPNFEFSLNAKSRAPYAGRHPTGRTLSEIGRYLNNPGTFNPPWQGSRQQMAFDWVDSTNIRVGIGDKNKGGRQRVSLQKAL